MTAAPALPRDNRLRVLIVDDHEDTAAGLKELVSSWGWHAATAHDGAEAMAQFDALRPTVGLLDLNLPGTSGYDVAQQLRDRAWRRRLYFVAITGDADAPNDSRGRGAGIAHHLLKPVNPGVLKRILASYQFAEEVAASAPRPGDVAPRDS